MTDITTFPTIHRVLWSGNNIIPMTASGTISAGQVVSLDATGVSVTVRAGIEESGERPVGVALFGVTDGQIVSVCTTGCVCYVANADDSTVIDAGDILRPVTRPQVVAWPPPVPERVPTWALPLTISPQAGLAAP